MGADVSSTQILAQAAQAAQAIGPNSGGQPQHSHSETGRFGDCANAYRRLSDFYQAYMMHNVITS